MGRNQYWYTLVCMAQAGNVPMRLESSAQIRSSEVMNAIENMDFWVRFGSDGIVDFKSWWAKNKKAMQRGLLRIEADGGTLEYDGVGVKL